MGLAGVEAAEVRPERGGGAGGQLCGFTLGRLLCRCEVPEENGAVTQGRGESGAVGGYGEQMGLGDIPLEAVELFAGRGVPDANVRAIAFGISRGGDEPAIRGHGDGLVPRFAKREREDRFAGCQLPQPHRAIVTAGGEESAIAGHGDVRRRSLVPFECLQQPPGLKIPDVDRPSLSEIGLR